MGSPETQVQPSTRMEQVGMETIHTLQEFMLHTKNIIYILMVIALAAMPVFWKFLNGDDKDSNIR